MDFSVVIPVIFLEEANNAHYNSIDLRAYRKSHIHDGAAGESSLELERVLSGRIPKLKFAKIEEFLIQLYVGINGYRGNSRYDSSRC
ncbi:unnamed protein product [Brassica oleracea]